MGVFRLRSSLSVSVALHAFIIFAWAILFSQQAAQNAPKKLTWIEVDPLPKTLEKLRKQDEAARNKRIVETAQGRKTETAAPDAFLGAQTQTFDRETVNKQQRITPGGAQSPTKSEGARAQSKPKNQASPMLNPQGALGALGIPIVPKPKHLSPQEELAIDRLAPVWSGQGGVPQDYIKGLKESERTALNTKEYVFYGYFQRIRQRLDLAWSSILREHLMRLYRGGRQLASDTDLTTKITVTLNTTGQVVRVQINEESGVRDLDDAAVKAFNRAGPFPNPPKGIVDREGLIKIRWDFVLKT